MIQVSTLVNWFRRRSLHALSVEIPHARAVCRFRVRRVVIPFCYIYAISKYKQINIVCAFDANVVFKMSNEHTLWMGDASHFSYSIFKIKFRNRRTVICNGHTKTRRDAGTPGHDAGTADARAGDAGDDYVLITGRRDTGTRRRDSRR